MRGLFDDTIAAIATPSGRGAVALLRLSGPGAIPILHAVCPELGDRTPSPREQRLLTLRHPESNEHLDRGLVTLFPGPASYTGEDTVEISTHGGVLTPQLVLDALYAAGARAADPGEFTRRALLNGKLDLLQAEAVLDLIDGDSPALHRAAVHQMERGLSTRVEGLRREILRLEGMVAYSIDFPEEDEPPVPLERIDAAVGEVRERIMDLLRTAPEGERLREGALVVLAGRPNSGKSSLFNALVGLERAIVTEIPGTTRDALESSLTLGGYPFRVVDTAGLRTTVDRVEQIGIEVARRYLTAAEIVVFCAEAGRELDEDEQSFLGEVDFRRVILARTKADLVGGLQARGTGKGGEELVADGVVLSAHTGEGMDVLREALLTRAFGGLRGAPAEAPLITRERHARALRAATAELQQFRETAGEGVPMEFAATHLRSAVVHLETLIGAVTVEDLLDEVFGAFCVGK